MPPAVVCVVSWLVPGAGHLMQGRRQKGLVFLIATPDQYISNISWWLKVLFLAIAGVNVLMFELTQRDRADSLPAGSDTPYALKMIGGVSLVSWMMVLVWGRMLAFLGNAF